MSDKRKKLKFDAKREKRRLKRLADEGRLRDGGEIPRGAVAADLSQQVRSNSYSPPPLFYMDMEFECVDCGRREIWTAHQQKWYFEVAKGSLYATAVRCRECRKAHSKQRQGHGDPNPIKGLGSLMKRIRSDIEPGLLAAGFELEGRNYGKGSTTAWLDYSRPGLILRCFFDPRDARLIAETLDDSADCRIVAKVELCCVSTPELLGRIDAFTSAVQEFVRILPGPMAARGRNDT